MKKIIIALTAIISTVGSVYADSYRVNQITPQLRTAIVRGLSIDDSLCFEHIIDKLIPKKNRNKWSMTYNDSYLGDESVVFGSLTTDEVYSCSKGKLTYFGNKGPRVIYDYGKD